MIEEKQAIKIDDLKEESTEELCNELHDGMPTHTTCEKLMGHMEAEGKDGWHEALFMMREVYTESVTPGKAGTGRKTLGTIQWAPMTPKEVEAFNNE